MKFDQLSGVRSSRLFEGVVDQLYGLIQRRRLQPGDKLPPEAELCDAFGVSRTSVRAAIRTLGALGLVDSRNGGGHYVKPGLPEGIGEILRIVLFHDLAGVAQIYEVRKFLESWTAHQAAGRLSQAQLQTLARLNREREAEIHAGRSGADLDYMFHWEIAKAAENEVVLRLLYPMLKGLLEEVESAPSARLDQKVSLRQHRRILTALRKRDSGAAMKEMWDHLTPGPQTAGEASAFPLAAPRSKST